MFLFWEIVFHGEVPGDVKRMPRVTKKTVDKRPECGTGRIDFGCKPDEAESQAS